MVDFPTWITDCDSDNLAPSDLFISSDASICLTMAFPPLGNSDHVLLCFHCLSVKLKKGCPFQHKAFDSSCADWDSLHYHLEMFHRRIIFELSANAAASEFEWVQVGIDVYIPRCKCQVKLHSSPWFSAACAVATVHRNLFFPLYQQNKPSKSKVKFKQTRNRCKRVLEAAKLTYANKTKEPITSQKFAFRYFWRIADSVFDKDKSAILPLFNGPEVLSSASDKAKLFAGNFSKNSNLLTRVGISFLVS